MDMYKELDKQLIDGSSEVAEPVSGVYATKMCSIAMCKDIIDKCNTVDSWGTRDNKHYRTNDVLLKAVDVEMNKEYMMALNSFVRPILIDKYNLSTADDTMWYYESFVVKYTPEVQAGLDLHHDASVLTTLLTLNDEFEGGGTYFKSQDATVIGNVGDISVHPGRLTHYHSANDITSGERYVLVTFINMNMGN